MEKVLNFFKNFRKNWPHHKAQLLGSGDRKGILYYIAVYFLSITFAFVFIYPIFYMFMISLMSNTDLVDSTVLWIPSKIYWNNYLFSIRGLSLNQLFIFDVFNTFSVWSETEQEVKSTLILELFVLFSIPVGVAIFTSFYAKIEKVLIAGIISFGVVVILMFLPKSYVDSVYVSGTVTLVTVMASALTGYGLARFEFPGKGLIFVLMLLIYILPKTLLFIPRLQLYSQIGLKGSMFALWIPAFLGQGIQATFFILIFFQFFRMIPNQIEESAYLDGANSLQIFIKIAVPMAVPAFVISATYGFAVNWNELFLTNIYLDGNIKTIPMLLQGLQAVWDSVADYAVGSDNVDVSFTEAKSFAGTILSIIPLVIMYGIVQRYFIESIDKSGIAGE